jgi:uncharacterized membrane protein YjjP (DUF1212 family)/uncharacterized membrane protein YjjB (DUF3815 family)
MSAQSPAVEADTLLEFLFRLGQAYLACGEQTAKVELILRRIATARGARRARVVLFPTAVFISLHDGEQERVTLAEGPTDSLRLDQIAEVYELGIAAQRGEVSPEAGLERLTAIRKRRPQFGWAGVIGGHAVLSAGVSLVLAPSVANVLTAAVLGIIVGVMKALNQNRALFAVPVPVVAAGLVSSLVFLAMRQGLPLDPLHVLIPPLVTFLPGGMLTLGMVELAYGDMVSGSSRLITGFVQLILLAFGLVAGAVLIGYTPDNLLDASSKLITLPWVPWIGVVVFGFGVYLHFSAPPSSFGWMLPVLLLTFATQQIAALSFGTGVSGFFGMLVATPLSYLIHMRFKGPAAMVTFLPCFWLLVPGALGLLSLKRMLNDRDAGIDGMISVVIVFTSIALGTLMGASLYKWLTETFGRWQLQIGRAGNYLRRKR